MIVKKIVVMGLGYVGLPLAVLLSRNFKVVGVDVNRKRVEELKAGRCFIDEKDVKAEFAGPAVQANFTAKTAPEAGDVFIIAVPTPVNKDKSPGLAYVDAGLKSILPLMQKGNLVILESTVPPLTTRKMEETIEKATRLKVPEDILLAHCPERVLPGNSFYELINNNRIVGGVDKRSTDAAAEVYSSFVKGEIVRTDSTTAEFCKCIENAFRDMNIAFANELSLMAENIGINIKEAIEIANKHPRVSIHKPGIGVGGHCFDGSHGVFVKHPQTGTFFFTLKELFEHFYPYDSTPMTPIKLLGRIVSQKSGQVALSTHFLLKRDRNVLFFPKNLEVISYDLKSNKASFRKVVAMSRRATDSLLAIKASHGYILKVTDKHPIIIHSNGALSVKFASEVNVGDMLVLSRKIPEIPQTSEIDILGAVLKYAPEMADKIRVKPVKALVKSFASHLSFIKPIKQHDYYRYNYLPLSVFLKVEKNLNIPRSELVLFTGRGPSAGHIPAILKIDGDFARLLGYYLSEGCLTKDSKNDVAAIIGKLGIKCSFWKDPKWNNLHIKISSYVLSLIFKEVLHCGTNCYDMQIPKQMFFSNPEIRLEVLKGLMRGDGGVSHKDEKNHYFKNGREYVHNNNRIVVSYFTSSDVLFQQVLLILLENGIVPGIEKRNGLLRITGKDNVLKLNDVFAGEKSSKIAAYLAKMRKDVNHYTYELHDEFVTIKVENIVKEPVAEVYSLEVKSTNTLLTNNGLVAHNCIPLDPWFLVAVDKRNTTMIQSARKINDHMPHVTADKIAAAVAKIKNPKIVTIGLSYKPDVGDLRESPAVEVVHILRGKGFDVSDFDPLIEGKKYSSLAAAAKGADCLAILVEHSAAINELELKEKEIKAAMKSPIIVRF